MEYEINTKKYCFKLDKNFRYQNSNIKKKIEQVFTFERHKVFYDEFFLRLIRSIIRVLKIIDDESGSIRTYGSQY